MSDIVLLGRLSLDHEASALPGPALRETSGQRPSAGGFPPCLLAVALVLSLVVSPAASGAETYTCLADQDAFISEHYADRDTSDADLLSGVYDTCHSGAPCDQDGDGYVRSAPLIRFNLYPIPPYSTIQSCELHLECWDFSSARQEPLWVDALPITSPWVDTVTWFSRPTWAAAPRARAAIGGVGGIVMDDPALAEIVQAWVDGTAYNHGLLLWPEAADSIAALVYSMETAPSDSAAPCLTVSYEPPPEGTSPFFDVGPDYWAFDEILACVNGGVVEGYPDRCYRPSLPVLRDQMAVFIARALAGGDENVPTGPAEPTFPDVLTDHWAFAYVEYCHDQAVVQGYWNGYHPDEVVNRAQMAVYVARAMVAPSGDGAIPDPEPPPSFPDVPADFWAYQWIEYCHSQGVVQGYWDGYHPEEVVNRAQMAVYVQRAFELPV